MASLRERVKANKEGGNQQADANTFIEAANGSPTEQDSAESPWEVFDKKAVPRTTFNLRLNDYELSLLRWLAEHRDESMQKVAKRVLIPLLEQLAHEAQRKTV